MVNRWTECKEPLRGLTRDANGQWVRVEDYDRLRAALQWYADPVLPYAVTQATEPRSAVHADGGKRARAALAGSAPAPASAPLIDWQASHAEAIRQRDALREYAGKLRHAIACAVSVWGDTMTGDGADGDTMNVLRRALAATPPRLADQPSAGQVKS